MSQAEESEIESRKQVIDEEGARDLREVTFGAGPACDGECQEGDACDSADGYAAA